MCQFKSAIVLLDEREKGGFKLLLSPWTESHDEIEKIFKLREGKSLKFAKVEFTPDDMAFSYLPNRYKLHIDEARTPDWFDAEMEGRVTGKMTDYIKSIIVSGDVDLLIGGQFIISPGAKISSCHSMVINAICGGTISDIRGGTISAIRGGTISDIWGGTISAIKENFDEYGSIKTISKSAKVTDNRPNKKNTNPRPKPLNKS